MKISLRGAGLIREGGLIERGAKQNFFTVIYHYFQNIFHCPDPGWYAYVSSASYTTHRKKATLVSPWLKGFRCVSFAYCMNGKNMGKLDVFAQDNTGRWYLYPFYKKGHQGKGWHDVEISLENPRHKTYNYRV